MELCNGHKFVFEGVGSKAKIVMNGDGLGLGCLC